MSKAEYEDYKKLSAEITNKLNNTAVYESWLVIQEYVDRIYQREDKWQKSNAEILERYRSLNSMVDAIADRLKISEPGYVTYEEIDDKIIQLQNRITELEQINQEHQKLNGELRSNIKEANELINKSYFELKSNDKNYSNLYIKLKDTEQGKELLQILNRGE